MGRFSIRIVVLLVALGLGALTWLAAEVVLIRTGRSHRFRGRHRRRDPLVDWLGHQRKQPAAGPPGRRRRHHLLPPLAAVAMASLAVAVGSVLNVDGADARDSLSAPPIFTGTIGTIVPPRTGTGLQSTTSTSSVVGGLGSGVVVRGVYGRDSSARGVDGFVGVGFDTVLVGADRAALDDLQAAGLKAVVWLGEYHRTAHCDFEFSDVQVTEMVSGVAGHPAVAAYYLADEPSIARTEACPSAPEDLKRRSDLVHSLDASATTFVTLTTWDGVEAFPFSYWVGTVDVFGLVVFPCFQGSCDFSLIDQAVAEASRVGLGEYWAVIQDFSDSWYDLPTPDQVAEQFRRWSTSPMTGYLVFAARGFGCCQPSDFETNPAKRTVLETWNRS